MLSTIFKFFAGGKVQLIAIALVAAYIGYVHLLAYNYKNDSEKKSLTIERIEGELETKESVNKALEDSLELHAKLYKEAVVKQAKSQATINKLTVEVKNVFQSYTEAQTKLDTYRGRLTNAAIKKTVLVERIANASIIKRMLRVEQLTTRTGTDYSNSATGENSTAGDNDNTGPTSGSENKDTNGRGN